MKKIIIMGASSGIGLEVAEMLASRNVRIGVAARNTKPLEELKSRYPDCVEYASIDICKPDAPLKLDNLINAVGGMDIYLHVAGIGYENLDLDPEREAAIVNTNCVGFSRMLSAAYRYFRSHGIAGQIAAVTSVAGTNGIGRLSAYSSSKKFGQTYITALEQLSFSENAGIKFTDIRPGWVRTPLLIDNVKYPFEMSVEYAARQVIYAIAKQERVWIFDWRWDAVVNIWRWIPDKTWVRMRVPVSVPDIRLPWPISALTERRSDERNANATDDPEGPVKENAKLENKTRP